MVIFSYSYLFSRFIFKVLFIFNFKYLMSTRLVFHAWLFRGEHSSGMLELVNKYKHAIRLVIIDVSSSRSTLLDKLKREHTRCFSQTSCFRRVSNDGNAESGILHLPLRFRCLLLTEMQNVDVSILH